jgi:hypothetical protein
VSTQTSEPLSPKALSRFRLRRFLSKRYREMAKV